MTLPSFDARWMRLEDKNFTNADCSVLRQRRSGRRTRRFGSAPAQNETPSRRWLEPRVRTLARNDLRAAAGLRNCNPPHFTWPLADDAQTVLAMLNLSLFCAINVADLRPGKRSLPAILHPQGSILVVRLGGPIGRDSIGFTAKIGRRLCSDLHHKRKGKRVPQRSSISQSPRCEDGFSTAETGPQ